VAGETFSMAVEARPSETPDARVLFEDEWLVALDKPAGLPSQGTLSSAEGNAVAWAERHVGRPVFSVHRLDAGTSGVLLIAKSQAAATRLAAAFKDSLVAKRYLCVGSGRLASPVGSIEAPLRRSPTPGRWQVAAEGGLPSRTDFELLASSGSTLLVAAEPKTGRTHQIRVHLAHAGAPLLGDRRYRGPSSVQLPGGGAFVAEHPMLHASRIRLAHPGTGAPLEVLAPLPTDFRELIAAFGWPESA
jgi:RluA family pseudouridine synthase